MLTGCDLNSQPGRRRPGAAQARCTCRLVEEAVARRRETGGGTLDGAALDRARWRALNRGRRDVARSILSDDGKVATETEEDRLQQEAEEKEEMRQ